ncbi:hypothetical protein BsWGS_25099 [Bradybaena similaris]
MYILPVPLYVYFACYTKRTLCLLHKTYTLPVTQNIHFAFYTKRTLCLLHKTYTLPVALFTQCLCVSFFQTADEKLRNIGKHQSGTVVQTQNFTFYKNQPKRETETPVQPQQHPQQQQQQSPPPQKGPDVRESTAHGQELVSVEGRGMDDRVVLRNGRRERNGLRVSGEAERADFKRRSRSEGPNRRVRQSMDERESGRKQGFDGGGKGRKWQESSDSEDYERNPRLTTGCVGFESDSDSDPKKWNKNPLVVRRVKRSDKVKHAEKRLSGTENGVGSTNRDSWVYCGNEDSRTDSHGGGHSSSRDSGSSNKGSSKYQKLEEMRKKRINLAVTSDEEATPASRISRLRQRALQGGLGEQVRSTNASRFSGASNGSVPWDDVRPQPVEQLPSSDSSYHKPHGSGPAFERTQFGSRITPANQPSTFGQESNQESTRRTQPLGSTNISSQVQSNPALIPKNSLSFSDSTVGLGQQHWTPQQKPVVSQQIQPRKQAPARPAAPPVVVGARQSFFTMPETNSPQAASNSSMEVGVRRITTQVRIPSLDSIVTSPPKSSTSSGSANQAVTFSNNLRQIQARGSPTPNQELFQVLNTSRSSGQFNDVVEMRLKNTREPRPEPQPKIAKKSSAKPSSFTYGDDTLDELVESNIQYLDSDFDKSKTKRSLSSNVIRSSSLPDPRRMSTTGPREQPSIQVQASTSIEFHVTLPTEPLGAPLIQIAPYNAAHCQSDYAYDNLLRSQPDVVPRKFSYDSHSRMSRPNSEYFDRDDMSKSDSQLNAQIVIPSYLGNSLHPDQTYARVCVSDINLRSDAGTSLHAPQMDKGMFSDVEYDIEVSERVKKWEKFMKSTDGQIPNEKKNVNLTTIQENAEADSLMLPSEVRKSVLLSKNGSFGSPYTKDVTYTPPTRSRPFSSDTSLNRFQDANEIRMFSVESNANRIVNVGQDPQVGPRLGIQSQSVTSLFHTPLTSRPEKGFLSANELRQQMLANRQPALSNTSGPMWANLYLSETQISENTTYPHADLALQRSTNVLDLRELPKRASRYHDELGEIASVKADSVTNLRRRFDTDSSTITSEDDRTSVSTSSAKLQPQSKESPTLDWLHVLPGYESKIKDTDVWSPNLESTQGVPVSIERVTARTLQTIPFSEDPFWKEIEEMTSFDPSSMAGHLSVSKSQETGSGAEVVRSQHQIELNSPYSSTLPSQSRNSTTPIKERMQRSKSLYTPNITPLSINVSEKSPSRAVSALDEVLEDISRSSMERKQLSPKKKAFESDMTTSSNSGISNAKGKHDHQQPGFKFEGGQLTFTKPPSESHSQKPMSSGALLQEQSDKAPFPVKQPLQFYQQQRQQSQQQQQHSQNRQSQVLSGSVNSYHLDPDVLKQKLLSTGLVVETDTEEPVSLKQSRSSSLGAVSSIFLGHTTTAPTYTSIASHSTANIPTQNPLKPTYSISSSQSVDPSTVGVDAAAPWAKKQSGSSALDDIQKALAPFHSTTYQPDAEALYGASRLQSFNDPSFDTTKGPQTKTTSWTYQPLSKNNEQINSSDVSSSNSLSRLQQVNASMDDLKDLAQNVERKINDIKGKLQTADDKSLDSILASLRRLTPEVKSQDKVTENLEDYYTTKKSKLSDALLELNRIYNELELNNDNIAPPFQRGKQKPYTSSKSNDFFLNPKPKSEHLRPMQTRISSVFIPGLEFKNRINLDKETESEFEILSKSFRAIVDEVNQTTDMLSRSADSSRTDNNTAPETQKQTTRIVLKAEGAPTVKNMLTSSTDSVSATKVPPAIAPKPQEVKAKGGRFRAKQTDAVAEENASTKRLRSKSVPELDSNTKEMIGAVKENAAGSRATGQTTSSTTITLVETPVSDIAAATSSPAVRQRVRVRPVRDNKIIQDDRTAKQHGPGVIQSPQPSPVVSRKIIYNSSLGDAASQLTQQEPAADEAAAQTNVLKLQTQAKQQPQAVADTQTKPAVVSSPASLKRIPPPTAAKPSGRAESSMSTSSREEASANASSKSLQERVPLTQEPSHINKSTVAQSNGSPLKQPASAPGSNPLQPAVEKPAPGGMKSDDTETGVNADSKAKRRLGSGVALMLDKFNTGDEKGDKIKTRQGTQGTSVLTESLQEGDDSVDGIEEESSKKAVASVKIQAKQSTEDKSSPTKITKSAAHRPGEKRIPALASDANKPQITKPAVTSSVEKKIAEPESKTSSSGTSSPQPSSPVSKPPHYPWKRQMSDPDKQSLTEAGTEVSVASPKFVSRIPRLVTTHRPATAQSTSGDSSARKVSEQSQQKAESPRVVPRRVRPVDRKMQKDTIRERPHSFHELISCSEKHPSKMQRFPKLRKCASAGEVHSETLVSKVFRSETSPIKKGTEDDKAVLLKLEMKVMSS